MLSSCSFVDAQDPGESPSQDGTVPETHLRYLLHEETETNPLEGTGIQ